MRVVSPLSLFKLVRQHFKRSRVCVCLDNTHTQTGLEQGQRWQADYSSTIFSSTLTRNSIVSSVKLSSWLWSSSVSTPARNRKRTEICTNMCKLQQLQKYSASKRRTVENLLYQYTIIKNKMEPFLYHCTQASHNLSWSINMIPSIEWGR